MAYGNVNVAVPGVSNDESSYLKTEQAGAPGGVATLDADGKLSESQHGDIRASVAAMRGSINAIELKFGTNVTKNPFSATFSSLDGLTVTGVWNAEQARVEF